MKLLLINNYLQKLDVLRANPLRNAYELSELKSEISNMIDGYVLKHKKEDVFTDILNHIYLDVEDALYEAFELSGGRL
jgi:hypothetical protein